MKSYPSFQRFVFASVALGWLSAAWSAGGAEPAREFLDGLRQRGYHDMAVEYLDRMRTSPRCSEDFKAVIDYEAGVTQIAASQMGTIQARQDRLDQARQRLNQFIKDHSDHELVARANTQLANVLVERGRIQSELASRSSRTEADKDNLMAKARALYEEAQKVFQAAEEHYYERAKGLKELDDPNKIPNLEEARREAYRDVVQARLFLAGVTYEIGKTYKPGSKEHTEKLTEAVKKYGDLYEKYSSYTGGLYARMWEGRTYKELGETDKATNIFKEMLTLPAEAPILRMLMNQSLGLALETYLLPDVKKYQDAVGLVNDWEDKARPDEMSTAEGLKVLYLGGLASMELAKTLQDDDKTVRENRTAAKRRLERVARFVGEHRRDAILKLQDPLFGEKDEVADEDLTYLDAKDKGDFAWGTFVVVKGKLEAAKSQKDQESLNSQLQEARAEAIKYYKTALGLADREVARDELNLMRFRMTYLYFVGRDFYRAAVLGEFLARRQPTSVGARTGAEIAVKAYRALYALGGPQDDRSFEKDGMEGIAKYVTTRWKGEPEADEAWIMLADTFVDERNPDRALECVANISEESPRRGQAELRTGQAFWAAYVRGSNEPEDSRTGEDDLEGMATKARETLKQGIDRMRRAVEEGAPVDHSLARSVLSLAQIDLAAGEAAQAVALLDDSKIGPMALVRAGHPVVKKGSFTEDTYKTALRAYVGAQKLDEAEQTMSALEEIADDSRRLTRIYIALGRELELQLAQLGKQGKNEERRRVSDGFEVFLDRILEREEGNTFNSLNWVAETYMGLGDGLTAGRSDLPEEAVEYYKKAAAAYARIIRRTRDQDPELGAPEGAETTITVRLAACLRKLGQYDKAMKLLIDILRDRDKRVDVQVEAARTYQAWGSQRPGYYEFAIVGGNEEDGRRLVWGWAGIANRVAAYEQYQDIFHEARYNLAVCRARMADDKTGDERKEMLRRAELDIIRVQRQYPKMGGEKWYGKYDELLQNIQKLLGKRPTGLDGQK